MKVSSAAKPVPARCVATSPMVELSNVCGANALKPIVKATWVLIAWSLAALPLAVVSAQDANGNRLSESSLVNDPLYNLWRKNSNVTRCGVCHYSPSNDFTGPDTDFCALSEARQWLDQDKHAISRLRIEPLTREQVIERTAALNSSPSAAARSGAASSSENLFGESNVVSKTICMKLGYDTDSDEGYASFQTNCLTCHAGYDIQRSQPIFAQAASQHPGIECNYCHQINEGPAAIEPEAPWIALHSQKSWRLKPPEKKAALRMRHLVDAAPQAELCTSCHIGDHSRGMFVSHEMYAAGHPPLPGFELQTFLSALPPHWRDLSETARSLSQYAGIREYFQLNVPGFDASRTLDETFWGTRMLLVGALKSAERSTAMIAEVDDQWGDYALYDCAACHHELRLPSPRQSRPVVGTPGRPRLLEWPTPLLEAALSLMDDHGAEVNSARMQLMTVVSQSPFGIQSDCVPAAQRLRSTLAEVAAILVRRPIGAEQAKNVLWVLCGKQASTANARANFEDSLIDYQAARQVVWAIQLIDSELAAHGQPLPEPARNIISNLGKSNDQEILSTDLPSGQSSRHYDTKRSDSHPGYLEAELQRIKQYDRQILVRQLLELQNLL